MDQGIKTKIMALYPIIISEDVKITSIVRMQGPATCNTFAVPTPNSPVPIDISTSSINTYLVTGLNLNQIISANWYPASADLIVFKMVPWQTYSPVNGQAIFGIRILTQETFDYQRSGAITFKLANGLSGSIPAATFSSWPWLFNPADTPLQGWDTGDQTGGGGAY